MSNTNQSSLDSRTPHSSAWCEHKPPAAQFLLHLFTEELTVTGRVRYCLTTINYQRTSERTEKLHSFLELTQPTKSDTGPSLIAMGLLRYS